MNKKDAKRAAELLLNINAITIKPRNPFKFTSGILSPIYIDNRLVMSFPKVRKKIIEFYVQIIKEKIGLDKIDLLSGTATAAIPHTAFLSQRLNIPMIYVRDTKKGHGKENQIEGKISKGQMVLVIEEHVSTGGSLIGNVKAVRDAGGKVDFAIVTTTFLIDAADENFKKEKVKVFTITDFEVIIDTAIKNNFMMKKDRKIVREWAKDPKGWGKKFGFEK